jgi:putative transposase
MKNLSDKQKVDPSVECLTRLFPEDFIRSTATEAGFIQRERKIDPVILFWVIVLGFGVNFLRTIRGLKRKYENESNIQISISSFNDRFTPQMEKFLKKCVIHALEYQAQEPGLKLGAKLMNFKDILIQDNTIIRLHESLANLWPAARSKKIAAGLKLSCVVSAVADGVKTVRIFSERTAEVKTLRLGPWLKDRILLTDLGFFDYNSFDKIERYGGFFVSRLKGNANPTIVGVNKICRGNSINVVGKKLKDVLPLLKRQILDVVVEVEVKRRKYKGKTTKITRTFRLICVLNEETEEYHVYLTNISVNILYAEDIAELYGARWEVELLFKELKDVYHIDQIESANPNVVKCLIWVAILTLMCSRRILRLIKNVNPENAYRYTHLRWAKVFTENADRLLKEVLQSMGLKLDMTTLFDIWIGQGLDPNINRKRLMDSWIA